MLAFSFLFISRGTEEDLPRGLEHATFKSNYMLIGGSKSLSHHDYVRGRRPTSLKGQMEVR